MSARIWAIVPAGGTGSRMQSPVPKQYLELGGRPMIEHTLSRLSACPSVDSLLVGVEEKNPDWLALAYTGRKLAATTEPGVERADTVANCLRYICEQGKEDDWALVHDAARPCVRVTDIENLVEQVVGRADGGILAVSLSDTIKRGERAGQDNVIQQTVPREGLWRAMTPQLFRAGELLRAINSAQQGGVSVTDEASAMETRGARIVLVPCAPDNIKVTLPQDCRFAETILLGQQQEIQD